MLRQDKDYLTELMNYASKTSQVRSAATSFSIEDILLKTDKAGGASPRSSVASSVLASYLPLSMSPPYPAIPAYACKLCCTGFIFLSYLSEHV